MSSKHCAINTSPFVDVNNIGVCVIFGVVEMNCPTCIQWLLWFGSSDAMT